MGNQMSSQPRHNRHHESSPLNALPLVLGIASLFKTSNRSKRKGHGSCRSPPSSSGGSWKRKRRSGEAREHQHRHMRAGHRDYEHKRRSRNYAFDDRDSYGNQVYNRHSRPSSVRPKRPAFDRADSGYSGYSTYSARSGRSVRSSMLHANPAYRPVDEKVQRWL